MEFEEAMTVRAAVQAGARAEREASLTRNPMRVALDALEERLEAIEEKLDELLDVAKVQGVYDSQWDDC